MVALQCCVHFFCAAEWIGYTLGASECVFFGQIRFTCDKMYTYCVLLSGSYSRVVHTIPKSNFKTFKNNCRTMLVVQWLRLWAPTVGDAGLVSGQGSSTCQKCQPMNKLKNCKTFSSLQRNLVPLTVILHSHSFNFSKVATAFASPPATREGVCDLPPCPYVKVAHIMTVALMWLRKGHETQADSDFWHSSRLDA